MPETLLLLLFLSLLLPAATQPADFTFTGFHAAALTLHGAASIQDNGILRLTNDTSRIIGHAFYPTPLQFKPTPSSPASSFSTSFAFAIVPEYPKLGGHGLAFVASQDDKLAGAQPAQYLGLLNATDNANLTDHLFAVEFDTVQDFEFFDIDDNHVGVDLNSMRSNASSPARLNLKSGSTIQAWVDYDGARKLLTVSVSPSGPKPAKPTLSFPVDLTPLFKTHMYVGFSASTGLLASSHYLFGWSFNVNGAAAPSLDLSSLPSLPRPKHKGTTFIIVLSFSIVILFILAAIAAGYLYYKIKHADTIEPWELAYGPQRFSYSELKRATKGFRDRELLGFGGFGKVYRGTLPGSKTQVAVKRISNESKQGFPEFVAEIASIGRLRHRNLVQLQGWCRRRADLLLVYDYMPNGSLDKRLFSASPSESDSAQLTWDQRFRIIRGVASALVYLHEEWEHVVIHRDVKASNVLLDGELNGRLGDFGLAKLYDHGANPGTTRVVGTLGYLAPELTRSGKATAASDVFAFGALVLEVVGGRRPIEPKAAPEELVLVDLVWDRWRAGRVGDVVDPRLGGVYDMVELEVAVRVGLVCSHPVAAARPRMREVVGWLDGADPAAVPEVGMAPAAAAREFSGRGGFEDFVHSYATSSYGRGSSGEGSTGGRGGEDSGSQSLGGAPRGRVVGPDGYSALSIVSRGSM